MVRLAELRTDAERRRLKREVGQRIKALRLERGLSQPQVATPLGVATSQVCRWELGERMPRTVDVAGLARLFEVPTDYIILGDTAKGEGTWRRCPRN